MKAYNLTVLHMNSSPAHLKNIFLISVIAMLSITALVGIVIFLRGDFGIVEGKILSTTAAIGGLSLAALCGAFLYERGRLPSVAFLMIGLAMVTLVYTLSLIWELGLDPSEESGRIFGIFLVATVSLAHASLLLLIKSKNQLVAYVQNITLLMIALVALIIISFIAELAFAEDNDRLLRLLGVFGILDGLGTIVTPLLYVIYGRK